MGSVDLLNDFIEICFLLFHTLFLIFLIYFNLLIQSREEYVVHALLLEISIPMHFKFLTQEVRLVNQQNELLIPVYLLDVLLKIT
jgi:hypothetical protein